jgi:type IV secretion system protein VirB9
MRYQIVSLVAVGLLAGCAKAPVYNPKDFVNPNHIVATNEDTNGHVPVVAATYGYGNDPAVIKAYQQYVKTGKAQNIQAEGFKTFAYDAHSRPIAECAPFHLCVIQLEQGEAINNIELGDSARWLVGRSLIGTVQQGSWQVAFKPKSYDLATDAVITTNKRTYNIGLVSKQGASTHVINFYYPDETMSQENSVSSGNNASSSEVVANESQVNLSQVNFNYDIKGPNVVWRPTRVFDDGNKTFIKMPEAADRYDLPVLYIFRDRQTQMVNYRYRKPYYVVDGLFQGAFLITGKGSHQIKVEIVNRRYG